MLFYRKSAPRLMSKRITAQKDNIINGRVAQYVGDASEQWLMVPHSSAIMHLIELTPTYVGCHTRVSAGESSLAGSGGISISIQGYKLLSSLQV